MAQYKIVRKGKSARKVEIRREKMGFSRSSIPAMLVCLLLAVVVWLYFVGLETRRNEESKTEPPVIDNTETSGGIPLEETDAGTPDENYVLPS